MEHMSLKGWLEQLKVFIVAFLAVFVAWLVLLGSSDPWTAHGLMTIAAAVAGRMTFISSIVKVSSLSASRKK